MCVCAMDKRLLHASLLSCLPTHQVLLNKRNERSIGNVLYEVLDVADQEKDLQVGQSDDLTPRLPLGGKGWNVPFHYFLLSMCYLFLVIRGNLLPPLLRRVVQADGVRGHLGAVGTNTR